jgi:rsbT co-antagonist protein RsbR
MRTDATSAVKTQTVEIDQTARLGHVFRWMAGLSLAFVPFELAFGLLLKSQAFLIMAGVSFGLGLLTFLAIVLLSRGSPIGATFVAALAVFAAAIAVVLLLPSMTAGMTIVPLVVVALLLPYLASRAALGLSLLGLLASLSIFMIGTFVPPLVVAPPQVAVLIFGVSSVGISTALGLLLLWQFSTRLKATVAQISGANAALQQARNELEQQVARRTADLSTALVDLQARAEAQARLLDENVQQRMVIREMSVPVLPVDATTMVIPLIGGLDSARLITLREQVLSAVQRSKTRYVLLDITGVPIVDTQVARGLLDVVKAARLLGAVVVLVGVRPEVAQAVVTLGLDMSSVPTRRSLEDGLAYTRLR